MQATDLDLEGWVLEDDNPCVLEPLIMMCPAIRRLSLARNGLVDGALDSLAACLRAIQAGSGGGLTSLDLSGNFLSADACDPLARSFFPENAAAKGLEPAVVSAACRVYSLDLSQNAGVGDLGAAILAAELKTRRCRGSLHLRGVGLSSAGFAALAAATAYLECLDLAHNQSVCPVGLTALCDGLCVGGMLQVLDLSYILKKTPAEVDDFSSKLSPDRIIQILTVALRHPGIRLRRLAVAGNSLDGERMQLLAEALAEGGSQLAELNLDTNCLGATWMGDEVNDLVRALCLKRPCSPSAWLAGAEPYDGVRILELCDNGLGDDAVVLIAEGLRQALALEVLRLARNSVGDRGAAALAAALAAQRDLLAEVPSGGSCGRARRRGVLELQLSTNLVSDGGLEALAGTASTAPSARRGPWGLEELQLEGHLGSGKGLAAVVRAVGARVALVRALLGELSAGPVGGGGAAAGGLPPRLLRTDLLPPPGAEEAYLEASLADRWPTSGGTGDGDEQEARRVGLEEALSLLAAETGAVVTVPV